MDEINYNTLVGKDNIFEKFLENVRSVSILDVIWNMPLLIFMHEYVTILTQNEAKGAATASGSECAPIASFWYKLLR